MNIGSEIQPLIAKAEPKSTEDILLSATDAELWENPFIIRGVRVSVNDNENPDSSTAWSLKAWIFNLQSCEESWPSWAIQRKVQDASMFPLLAVTILPLPVDDLLFWLWGSFWLLTVTWPWPHVCPDSRTSSLRLMSTLWEVGFETVVMCTTAFADFCCPGDWISNSVGEHQIQICDTYLKKQSSAQAPFLCSHSKVSLCSLPKMATGMIHRKQFAYWQEQCLNLRLKFHVKAARNN